MGKKRPDSFGEEQDQKRPLGVGDIDREILEAGQKGGSFTMPGGPISREEDIILKSPQEQGLSEKESKTEFFIPETDRALGAKQNQGQERQKDSPEDQGRYGMFFSMPGGPISSEGDIESSLALNDEHDSGWGRRAIEVLNKTTQQKEV